MHRQTRSGAFSAAAAVLVFSGIPLTAAEQTAPGSQGWLHVQIQGEGDDGQRVAMNLPLGAIGAVMAMAPENIVSSDGRLRVAEAHGVSVGDIRTMWQELMAVGDSQFVTIQDTEQTVRVSRVGEQIQVRVEGPDETALVDLPVSVVDALLSGDGDTLNLTAALDQLRTLRGDIVRVVEDERRIRVWVDEEAEQ